MTAIIGGTGAGKSTLVNLIPRFYDVDSGSILVDGVDIREMEQERLRGKLGFVPQKAVLFNDTVGNNIRYGKEDATDEEVARAAEVAQAKGFIGDMQEGFASVVAQGGTNLSGGQKQRLAIARALVRKPEIYVFDDTFSALDFRTDANLRAALRQEIADATVIIVAQRVNTIMDADRIIVLDDGEVVGRAPIEISSARARSTGRSSPPSSPRRPWHERRSRDAEQPQDLEPRGRAAGAASWAAATGWATCPRRSRRTSERP